MKVVRLSELENTPREVKGVGFTSFRFLLESDNMGFGVHKTVIPKGGPYNWHYKHHLEACYCIKGVGVIKDLSNGIESMVTPDSCYVLDDNDNHEFTALEDVVLISVFNPPLIGNEVHKADGSYQIFKNELKTQ